MPWITVTEYRNGFAVQVRKWVAEPLKAKPKAKRSNQNAKAAAAARERARRAAEARRRAAAEAARRRAARAAALAKKRQAELLARRQAEKVRQQQLAQARRRAYEELKQRQADLIERAGLWRDRLKPGQPPKPARPPLPGRQTRMQQESTGRAAVAVRTGDERRYWQEYGRRWQKKLAIDQFKAGDAASAQRLQAVLEGERRLAQQGRGTDTAYITELQKRFEQHASSVYSQYEKLVAQINGALDKGDAKKARRLYESEAFVATQKEFTRLFGNGRNPLREGAYNQFYSGYEDIARRQRDWWKDQMKASLQSKLDDLNRDERGGDRSEETKLLREQLDYLNGKNLPRVVDRYERVTGPDGKESMRPVYREATLQEALQQQYARIKMQQEQAVARKLAQEASIKRDMMRHGMTQYMGQWVKREHVSVIQALQRRQQQGLNLDVRNNADLQRVGDDLMSEWKKANPPPPVQGRKVTPEWLAWDQKRQAYEKQVYDFFGAKVPGTLERLIEAPGVSHALSILTGTVSATGAGARVLAKATFGTSTIELTIPLEKLPEHVRRRAESDQYSNIAFGSLVRGRGFNDPVSQWLETPEGQQWYAEHRAELEAESQQEDAAFAKGFYGDGDIGAKLQALNEYGSVPFSDDNQNLLFQLLADPTNAIPLKFTTYLARGKYALEAVEGASKLKTLAKAPHAFLTVDEGTLALKSELAKFTKTFKEKGLTREEALDSLRRDVAGIKDPAELKSAVEAWTKRLGLDPRDVSESQLFNLAEHLAKRRAGDEAIPVLTQADEFNAATKARIAEKEAAEKALTERAKRGTQKVKADLAKKEAEGTVAREKLAAKRLAQEEELKAAAEAKAKAAPPPPRRNPNVSGASDNRVAARETKAVQKQVRAQPKSQYEAADEFYRQDAMGNRLPLDFRYDADYMKLMTAAKAGDVDAAEQLVNRARYERNRFRMEQEDLPTSTRRRDVKFQPTKFDLAERAGTVSDSVATERLIRDRKTIRHLKRVAASNKTADEYVRGFTRRYRTKDERNPLIEGGKGFERSAEDAYGDLRSQTVSNRVSIGDDIIEAREASPRGLRELYQPFTHDNLRHYGAKIYRDLKSPEFVKRLQVSGFARAVSALTDLPVGAASYRDGGQWLFEVFHQLRLAKDWDKLREFSDYMTAILREEPDNIWAWMWKTMEERSVLPYSMHINDIRSGFYHAAEAWNLHPELAFSTIPSGYYARTPPVTFGLTPRLQGVLESGSPLFKSAPKGYTKNKAKTEITSIFMRNGGEPTRVLHYVAERFGEFFAKGEIGVRIADELTHAAALSMGPEALADVLVKFGNAFSDQIIRSANDTATPLADIITRLVDSRVRKWGRNLGTPRPEYGDLRQAIQKAYDAGRLKGIPPRAHTLMLLRNIQTNPDAYVGHLTRYLYYMKQADALDEAKALVAQLYDGEIKTDISRLAAEGSGRRKFKDALSGEFVSAADYARVRLWREYGFTPSSARLEAYATRRAENADALEKQFAEQKDRELWLREDSEDVRYTASGRSDPTNFMLNVEGLTKDIRAGVKGAEGRLEGSMRAFLRQLIDTGGASVDQNTLDELRDTVKAVTGPGFPEARRILLRLQEDMGFRRLETIFETAAEPMAWSEAKLRAQLRSLETANGAVKVGQEELHTQVQRQLEAELGRQVRLPGSHRINLDEMRAQYEAEAKLSEDPAAVPEPRPVEPEASAPRSMAGQMYDYIFDMSETEWFRFEKQRANRVLRSHASAERKAAARAHLKDIDAAEHVIRIEKSRGTYIPWKDRARYSHKVVERYGADAEALFAPKAIAPNVESAADAAVEQARTYWRLVQSAASEPVESGTRFIRHNGENVDHMPKEVWDELEQQVADAIAKARGWRASTRTRAHGRGRIEESQRPVGKLSDNDPVVIKAKAEALRQFARKTGWFVSVNAYDEARKVLWKGYVQHRTSLQLLARAQRIVARTGGDVGTTYRRLREKAAQVEARRQLGGLAYGEMFGQDPELVIAEFTRRYGDDGMLRSFTPELSTFQRKTLEEHVKAISGLDALDERMGPYLQSANRPPFESRELTRDFLTRIGAWAPRTSEEFANGARSWSIWDEAAYWRASYGEVPEWTDPSALASEFKAIFHDEDLYFRQMREWGIFSRSQELKLRLDGKTAKEIEDAALNGNVDLGVKGRRELELQRKFVMERYGTLVSKDGHNLDAMPWLMYPEELKRYLAANPAQKLPEGLIQTTAELDEVTALIEKAMEPYWEKYVVSKVKVGETVTYHDMFRVASEVQAQLLANPKWARRYRDIIGDALNRWAWFNRWLVFSNPSFLVTNAVDVPIKGLYYRFTRRSFFNPSLAAANPELAARADSLTPGSLGLDATTAMYRVKQAKSWERVRNPRGFTPLERALDRAMAVVDGTGEVFPAIAGQAELRMKMELGKGMYPTIYTEALVRLKDPELADAFTKKFINREVNRMWPTAGSGPIEQLWNRFVPFASYSVRNKVLFLREALAHPAIVNYIDRIGDYIEEQNLKDWEERHPGTEMPEHLRRRISLPWAPDYYLDLSTFSDAARGLKPIFDFAQKGKTALDWTSQWVRLVNPGVQAGMYMLFNAFNLFPKTGYVAVLDANGYPTGEYQRVTVPWTEPWSKDQPDTASIFWFSEAMDTAVGLGVDGWTAGELSQMFGQVLFFNGITTFDRGSVLNSFYYALAAKDKDAARKWLESEQGLYLQDWWEARAKNPRDVMNRFSDLQNQLADPSPWFHDQSPAFQQKVRDARGLIKGIRDAFSTKLEQLTPGTAEYKETKARMFWAINDVYLKNPELMMADVWGKSPAEWSRQLEDWQTDKLMDDFMALNSQKPQRADFDSVKAYNKAVDAWETTKQTFLQQYPQVAQRLNDGRSDLDRVRTKMEAEWDKVFDRISTRNEQIEEAKAILAEAGRDSKAGADAQDRLDILYLQNQLDYSLLERDYAGTYFSDEDFERLPPGVQGPRNLRQQVIQRAETLLDFDRLRYEKAVREGRGAEFLAENKYQNALRDAVLEAKGGSPFGKFDPVKFVKAVKSDAYLKQAYYKRNPEQAQKWQRTDEYIRHISVWGKLAGAGRWDEAQRVWDSLPKWVKDEYFRRNPDSKMRSFADGGDGGRRFAASQTAEYLGYMQRWVKMFDAGDGDAAMEFFDKMPDWVKERYYKKHPENRLRFEQDAVMDRKMREYFAGRKEDRAAYLKANPDLAKFLAQSGGKDAEYFAIQQAYRSIPKEEAWLRKVFRERYPEVFSQEAAGERRLRRVYDTLSQHPDILPEFEQWVDAIWKSYEEMLRHMGRPVSWKVKGERKVPARAYKRSLSAAEMRKIEG